MNLPENITRELVYMLAQTISIAIFFVWIWIIGIKLHHQKYGYYYIFVRLFFYNDKVPFNWLMEHKLFIFYTFQIFSLLLINIGLILQIKDETLYDKPWIFFVGNPLLALTSVVIIHYLTDYVKFLENRNFDEHIINLHNKIRRYKQSKDKRNNGTV